MSLTVKELEARVRRKLGNAPSSVVQTADVRGAIESASERMGVDLVFSDKETLLLKTTVTVRADGTAQLPVEVLTVNRVLTSENGRDFSPFPRTAFDNRHAYGGKAYTVVGTPPVIRLNYTPTVQTRLEVWYEPATIQELRPEEQTSAPRAYVELLVTLAAIELIPYLYEWRPVFAQSRERLLMKDEMEWQRRFDSFRYGADEGGATMIEPYDAAFGGDRVVLDTY